jgi:hypothetical protein
MVPWDSPEHQALSKVLISLNSHGTIHREMPHVG